MFVTFSELYEKVEAAEARVKATEAEARAAEVREAEIRQLIPVLWGLSGGDKMLRCASKDDEYRAELMTKYFTGGDD